MRGMEPLIELPRARWPALQQLCRGVWPQGLTAACILESYIRCPGLQQEFNFKVYCPGGDINSGMVATTDSNKEYLDLMIHPLPDGMTALENALLTTSIIDRKRPILVSAASIEVTTILDRIKDRIAVSVFYDESCKAVKHILGRQSRHFENLSCPAHTYLGTLKPEHLAAVDKTWTYHNSSTHKYFQALIQYELTYALYSESHKPLAWVTVNSEGALTHLFCVEEHRRRGYAEFITKIAINDLLSKGRDVLVYTMVENTKSRNLFNKLRFENIGNIFWVYINKH